jgi:hypothetical protein
MDTHAPAAPPDAIAVPAIMAPPMEESELSNLTSVEEDEFMEEYLWHVNQYLNEHIRFSDTKAGSVIVLAGAMLSLLYGAGVQRTFAGHSFGEWTLSSAGAALAFLALSLSVLISAWSMRPRIVKVYATGYIFWDSVLAHGSADAFVRSLNTQSRKQLLDHLAAQIYYVSLVCNRKFVWVARSIQFCLLGALLAAIVLTGR